MTALKFDPPAEFLNPLAQIFFIINLLNGLVFTLFSNTSAVEGISFAIMVPDLVIPFGLVLLFLSALNLLVVYTKKYQYGKGAAMLGFVTWLYPVILYAIDGLWLPIIVYPLPQVAFWAWYYFVVRVLQRQ